MERADTGEETATEDAPALSVIQLVVDSISLLRFGLAGLAPSPSGWFAPSRKRGGLFSSMSDGGLRSSCSTTRLLHGSAESFFSARASHYLSGGRTREETTSASTPLARHRRCLVRLPSCSALPPQRVGPRRVACFAFANAFVMSDDALRFGPPTSASSLRPCPPPPAFCLGASFS